MFCATVQSYVRLYVTMYGASYANLHLGIFMQKEINEIDHKDYREKTCLSILSRVGT
jgi:hypothetical protein